eukprot:GHUV01000801.1.p1 GENE.GHUV01000801.1~~GHUV01000801.1.p1  ORF type:complete len:940 (+),score=301.24 GHUV01000801.1:405-3224(+)
MASGGLRLSRQNTALDPVGCCLALEGRLSSESKEALSGALLQASRSGDLRLRSGEHLCNGGVDSGAAGPKCLSAQSHQLPDGLLDAFQSEATSRADRRCRGSSRSSSGLEQQDSLAEPFHTPGRQAGSHSPLTGGGSCSPPQRPPFSTALERTSTATLDANGGVDHGVGMQDPSCTCPPYAVKSTCGKRPNMEDTYALCPNICELPMSPMAHEYADKLPHRIAVQFQDHCMYIQPPSDAAQEQAQQPAQPGAQCTDVQHQTQWQHSIGPVGLMPQPQEHQQPQQHRQQQQRESFEDASAAFGGTLIPSQLAAAPDAENSVSSVSSGSDPGSVEKLHFFGVYDGHGGIEASQHCAQRLHYHLTKAVADLATSLLETSAGGEAASNWDPEVQYIPVDTVRVGEAGTGECPLTGTTAAAAELSAAGDMSSASSGGAASTSISMSGSDPDRDYGRSTSNNSTAHSGGGGMQDEVESNEGSAEGSEGPALTSFCGMMEEVLREAFLRTDEEFSNSGLQAGLVGSTAVVALVGTHRVWIANCGDSRAVLSRGGVAVQVTDDHKPEREDEAERVEKAGGQVLYWNGHRVMGVLAMSRAIGDHCLRPYVIPEPEITVFARHARDEILLLASDGLWDVLSNQEATDLALRSIKRAREKGASRKAAARVAATVLTKAAVDRGSRDNITVVIIDLAPPCAIERAAADKAAPVSPDSSSAAHKPLAHDAACDTAAAGSAGSAPAGGGGAGEHVRPSSSGSHKSSRPSSGRAGSSAVSNPFAAAAASPFSTAATGSSELPLPSGASGSGSTNCDAIAAAANAAVERSNRSSGSSGRVRNSATGASGTAFAAFSGSTHSSKALPGINGLAEELDSIDLSGAGAAGGAGVQGRSRLPSIESMAAASSAAECSTASSTLEEQPTIVEPPPAMDLNRQPSSSPFSAFSAPFEDGAD